MGKPKNKIDLNIVTCDQWLGARTDLLASEKACTQARRSRASSNRIARGNNAVEELPLDLL